ncbi:MAG TPA: aldo/keto reductase [Acidimicrobiales bacterium]|nr:aldo/keto reductase [Acidimicrobiales bacterium]
MERRSIGSLSVSVVGMGCNNFGIRFQEEQSAEVVHASLEAGINYFDTSDSYADGRSEECLGSALAGHRDEAVIATKYDGPPSHVRRSAEASLRRLGVEVIDLFQLHHPYPDAPIGETLAALGELVAEGKVREIGCSNFSVAQLRAAEAAVAGGAPRFVSVQNDYNLLNRKAEFDVLPECVATGVAFNAYFPLYHGLLTGKFRRGEPLPEGTRLAAASPERKAAVFTEHNFDVVEALTAFAEARGHAVLELAFARLLAEPGVVSVIAGATWGEQARANAAAGAWQLSADEIAEVDRLAPASADDADTPSRAHGVA